ncbi:murein hydrolase activator EnvC family protein [Penaeicola halotolerans]|uniref:murein hydrolase activator EnvC family protein n=1 Tax=Penaeicola halotolerans TaxID=2793196 RepID=UPI001CF83747|nr:peptidoglycan DD-metalloendopeptidase family protein [Penaeicola halotolerans]
MRHLSVLLLILFLSGSYAFESIAQTKTKAQLEKEKQETQKKIAEYEKILQQTTQQKRNTIGQLTIVAKQLEARANLIKNINNEVSSLNREIDETQMLVDALQSDLRKLKAEYAQMVYHSSKSNRDIGVITFLFSAQTFRELYMRLKYMQQYSDARKKQVKQIERVSQDLALQVQKLEENRNQKQALLGEERQQNEKLQSLKRDQEAIVSNLNKKEKELRQEVEDRKVALNRLNKQITDIINEEIRKAEAEARRKAEAAKKGGEKSNITTKPGSMPMAPEAVALSNSFAGNKGKFPWPVGAGFISKKFGITPHPTLKGIEESNDGVDIQTNPDAEVKSVYSGEVIAVRTIPGVGAFVMIKHGEYFTVYSKLKKVYVKPGQAIEANALVGVVYTDKNGVSELQFQVWKGKDKLNPELWLLRR